MILVELEIENYKQFAGTHHFRPTSEGVIFVSGLNGAGKTTLFEAIEWCLYNPTRIKNSEVGPHHSGGIPRVKVVLEDPATGKQIAIERQLKGATTKVVAYAQDDPTITIADGARAVARYVQQTLVGLDHRAFEATIFTRQKELGFFSTVSDPERRLQVGKLLGLEAIRAAEADLRGQAKQAADLARLTRQNLLQAVSNRNLDALLHQAKERETVAAVSVSEAGGRLRAIQVVLAEQIEVLNQLIAKLEQQREIEQQMSGQRSLHDLAKQRADQTSSQIATIDQRQQERGDLAKIAASIPDLQQTIAVHIARQQRQLQADAAQRTVEDRHGKIHGLEVELADFVAGRVTLDVPDWRWSREVDASAVIQLQSLITIASEIDLEPLITRIDRMSEITELVRKRTEETTKLDGFIVLREQLQAERAQLTAPSSIKESPTDPRQIAVDAEREINESNVVIQGLEEQRLRASTLIAKLQAEQFEDGCPTCGRPFTPDQRDDALTVFQSATDRIERELSTQEQRRSRARLQKQQAQESIKEQDSRREKLQSLDHRIETGAERITDQRAVVAKIEAQMAGDLAAVQMPSPPLESDITDVQNKLESLRLIANSVDYLASSSSQLRSLTAERDAATSDLAALAGTRYDSAAHQQSMRLLADAQESAGRLEEIDRLIASKPALETELANAGAAIATSADAVQRLQRDLSALGFDPTALAAAEQSVGESRSAELAAVVHERDAVKDLAIAEKERVAVERDISWAKEQETAVISHERESEDLESMTKAMSRFDRYVARRVTPELAAITSELLHEVTDGKYSEVEFDENYGIKVHDENGEAFPLATYSGGERDVVALCARLALSQYIGSQSESPPRFVVLDEIFGSLDDGRRNNVIAMLNALVSQTGVFSQMFVISHVGEMTTAGNIDQHWTVQENQSGFSTLSLDGAMTESAAQLTLV